MDCKPYKLEDDGFPEVVSVTDELLVENRKSMQKFKDSVLKYSERDDTISLNTGSAGFWYPVPLSRVATPRDLVSWVYHLAEKDWVSTDLLRCFMEEVCRHKNWSLH